MFKRKKSFKKSIQSQKEAEMTTKSKIIFALVLVFVCLCCSWLDLTFGRFFRDPTPPVIREHVYFPNDSAVNGILPWIVLVFAIAFVMFIANYGIWDFEIPAVIAIGIVANMYGVLDYYLIGCGYTIGLSFLIGVGLAFLGKLSDLAGTLTKSMGVYILSMSVVGAIGLLLSPTQVLIVESFNLWISNSEFGYFEKMILILGNMLPAGLIMRFLPIR